MPGAGVAGAVGVLTYREAMSVSAVDVPGHLVAGRRIRRTPRIRPTRHPASSAGPARPRPVRWAARAGTPRRPARSPSIPAGRSRCRRRGPATSRPARCSTGTAPSTGCPRRRARRPCAARWCTRVLEQMFGRPGPERTPEHGRRVDRPGVAGADRRTTPSSRVWCPTRISTRGWRRPRIWFGRTSPSRIRAASRRRRASSPSRSRSPTGCRSAASSTGSTSRRRPGELRVVDYKTGASPDPDFEAKALYQLKFYALMIYRLRGVVPAAAEVDLPRRRALAAVHAVGGGVARLRERGRRALAHRSAARSRPATSPPRRSGACEWCVHQAICPEWGGTPPPYPGPAAERARQPPRRHLTGGD